MKHKSSFFITPFQLVETRVLLQVTCINASYIQLWFPSSDVNLYLNSETNRLDTSFEHEWDSVWTNHLNFTSFFAHTLHNDVHWVTHKVLLDFVHKFTTWRGRTWSEGVQRLTTFYIFSKIAEPLNGIKVKAVGACLQSRVSVVASGISFAVIAKGNVRFPFGWAGFVSLRLF